LLELGADFVGTVEQTDDYFDNPTQDLAGSDRCLRLRCESHNERERLLVTYKGPKQRGAYKRRQELEFEISDPEAVRLFLVALGYERALTVRKTRQVWELDRCQVGLDTLDALGTFVEIEGPDEAAIDRVQNALGLTGCPHISESYACMLAAQWNAPERG
jgi:adenylate cyclase class 2